LETREIVSRREVIEYAVGHCERLRSTAADDDIERRAAVDLASRPAGDRSDATLEQRADVATVRRAMAKLLPTFREAVALRDIHELSNQEIAQRRHLPEGTVKSRISRGRKS
jgi:RNA polymerase sigma factor (sigma-70 family)